MVRQDDCPSEQAKKKRPEGRFFHCLKEFKALKRDMAQRTGLEPATPGVTGRYSNRLNYRCAIHKERLVGDDGIEPPTLCL
jgi:hypothetical protein